MTSRSSQASGVGVYLRTGTSSSWATAPLVLRSTSRSSDWAPTRSFGASPAPSTSSLLLLTEVVLRVSCLVSDKSALPQW